MLLKKKVFIFSYYEPNFIEKFLRESDFFQIFAKIEMTRKDNQLFGRHFETVIFLVFHSLNMFVFLYIV